MFSTNNARTNAIIKYTMLVLGACILSFGLYNVHSQSQITEGGVLGMTLFLKHWTGVSPGIAGFIMDALCYILGFKYFGKQFAKYALISSTSFAISYMIYEQFPPILPNLSAYPIFAALLGGCFVGVGVGLVVSVGGACGGDDALALIISHKTKLPISKAYLFTDIVVLALSLTYIPVVKILCSLITVTISSFIIGRIHKMTQTKQTE